MSTSVKVLGTGALAARSKVGTTVSTSKPQGDEDYWTSVVHGLHRERAVGLSKYVHVEWPLGVEPCTNTQIKDYHLGVKALHPRRLSLVRVSCPVAGNSYLQLMPTRAVCLLGS